VPLTFAGAPGASLAAHARAVSDPLPFTVALGEELAVTFEARGALAASSIGALPGSRMRRGAWAHADGALGGESWRRAVALATLEVEGLETRAVVALGDSITEGYLGGADDVRKAWPGVAQVQLGVPLLNAGVSGQGLYDALRHLEREVFPLQGGVTDCVVLLGTNDLGAEADSRALREQLARLFTRLRPLCTVWAATLLPKERSSHASYEVVRTQRLAVNRWLREEALQEGRISGLIDLEAVMRSKESVHLFAPGLGADGIHPTSRGQRLMGEEVARFLRARWAEAPVSQGP
jgi:lysophospholipase L1-like esterase